MYADQVFPVLRPRARWSKLPRGATPIISHNANPATRIGAACVGAKIDGNAASVVDAVEKRTVR